jgi:hypothetical protein
MSALRVGSRVFHAGHGEGRIVEVRPVQHAPRYVDSARGAETLLAVARAAPAAALGSFYSPDRFPYRVRFDRSPLRPGYEDVYSDAEFCAPAADDYLALAADCEARRYEENAAHYFALALEASVP